MLLWITLIVVLVANGAGNVRFLDFSFLCTSKSDDGKSGAGSAAFNYRWAHRAGPVAGSSESRPGALTTSYATPATSRSSWSRRSRRCGEPREAESACCGPRGARRRRGPMLCGELDSSTSRYRSPNQRIGSSWRRCLITRYVSGTVPETTKACGTAAGIRTRSPACTTI